LPPALATRLSPVDLALVAIYLVAITIFGLRIARKSKPGASRSSSLKTYFLADNTIPWWAIALSIVSAETSTLTIVSIPGVAFGGDLGFLQLVLGYMCGRIVVALLFLPRYFRGQMLTAYQLIDQRFGPVLHKVTAGLFLCTRAAAEGVRVFAISIVVSLAIGTGDILSIAIITTLTLLYTFEGGMAAVIWTDVVQMALYVIGTVIALITLGAHVPGGWTHIVAVAAPMGKFHLFNFALNLTQTYTFWAGLLGGTFLTMASHGTDQLMVQRMLAARNLTAARLALLSSGVVIFFQFTLFLLIGIGLYVFYAPHPQAFKTNDYIFPTFIVQQMPHGVAGLLVAAILAAAMSNLSAALNSLSSTTVVDFYLPLHQWLNKSTGAPSFATLSSAKGGVSFAASERPLSSTTRQSPANTERVSRLSTVVWAIVLFAIAVYSIQHGGKGHVVETGLSIASVAYGSLLGVFLLGTLTKYATQWGAICGMILGFAVNLFIWQGTFPLQLGTIIFPHIAYTWYVLIGAIVTFLSGLAFSAFSRRIRPATVALLLLVSLGVSSAQPPRPLRSSSAAPDFAPVSALITQAIADHKLPGAVLVVGHNDHVVFEQAYGARKLAGEPGLDGKPAAAEPMTEDTLFDMASLTKVLVTTTAILQLYEQGKLELDAPVARYLPDFAQNGKEKITVRNLITHYSGLPEDVSLKDDWGLKAPDKAEGIRRAMASTPYGPAGVMFKYSDINFITLGALVEKLSGSPLNIYARHYILQPISMAGSSYHPFDAVCGPSIATGAAIYPGPKPIGRIGIQCPHDTWSPYGLDPVTAPTAHDDESKDHPELNPDFDHLLRGTVHDPTTRRMGGVAGHAGLFSTAADTARFCQALLDKLLHNTGPFPLSQATLRLAISPQAPPTAIHTATIFTPDGKTTTGVAQRGLGWDLNSAFSRPRGEIFPIATATQMGSFGHTGFTGTSIWIDPTTDTYVILLANAIHPRGAAPISALRGQIATATAKALGLTANASGAPSFALSSHAKGGVSFAASERPSSLQPDDASKPCAPPVICDSFGATTTGTTVKRQQNANIVKSTANFKKQVDCCGLSNDPDQVQTGIDVLEQTNFAALTPYHHIALLTNQSGIDSHSHRTIDILNKTGRLTLIFTPEHGLLARQDTEHLTAESDEATHLPVLSLYGARPSDRHPKLSDLKKLDAVVIDLQDAGVRFWTYETVLGYFLQDCAKAKIPVIVLDRPNPIGGGPAQGPLSDSGSESYLNYMPSPVRHGMTFGELAQYFNANATLSGSYPPNDPDAIEFGGGAGQSATGSNIVPPATRPGLHAQLTVIRMQHWQRNEYFADTGLPWVAPSPNMKTPATNIVYPAVALMETTNMSVGRGSAAPYENFGAPFLKADELAIYLTARGIPGVSFSATTLPIADDTNHYPFHGQNIPAIHLTVTDRDALDSPELGIELLAALHHLYPADFQLEKAKAILLNAKVLAAIKSNKNPTDIAASWAGPLRDFNARRQQCLLYP
jgi:SSS family transporter